MRVVKKRMVTVMQYDEQLDRVETVTVPLTRYGQEILDLICDCVKRDAGIGYFGWDIGLTKTVVSYVANELGKNRHSVAGALGHLIDAGLIDRNIAADEYWMPGSSIICVSQLGWQAYRHWDANGIVAHNGDRKAPKPISFETWLCWDGEKGTCHRFSGPKIDW